ncbi:hypothetical protein QNA19_21045 [Rhodococcus fascians]|uniref:hypothetical protein n=1 Tax=Rhodococcoides fascians TaxID=1828 RepID=UPI0024B8B595|nr:hypothetical protein [Rhodococcus fascians]MDJ0428427.1 hypothetical protein [Rhodococcus fascians]
MTTTQFDVVLLGEPLVEVSTTEAFRHGAHGVLGVSGDVVNAGAAAAAAGASVALIARVSDDELGGAVCRRIRELGIDDTYIRRVPDSRVSISCTSIRRGIASSPMPEPDRWAVSSMWQTCPRV